MSGLIVHSEHPFNAEPPLARLRAQFTTQQADFYVRSHGDVPRLDPDAHRLRVGGRVARPLDLSLGELRDRFEPRTVAAVLQCAGNRRADMLQLRPVTGDPWAPGAIGNASWTGASLLDVLREAGSEDGARLHVALGACDQCEMDGERASYAVSIPMWKARAPEVLLAWAMNGEPLAPEHGAPLRAVVPGFAGVRSPKWLQTITVQDQPADSHFQARDYKLFPPDVTAETVDWDKGVAIDAMPLNAAICEPAADAEIAAGLTTLKGYAVASSRAVTRVDVSRDDGRSWQQAELRHDPFAPWSWTFWAATLHLPPGEHELAVRAWDSAGQTQPARVEDVWNFKGYLCAAWHRIRVVAR